MLVKFQDTEFSICPALAIIVCNLISYCDDHNLPFTINKSTEDSLEIVTLGWPSQLIYKYQYMVKRNYSDLALENNPFCIIEEVSIKIVVNKNANTNKFNKD